jgi:hypothetical protein
MKPEGPTISAYDTQIVIPQKITIDESVYEQFKVYTKLHGAQEWGGVCVGYQEGETFHVRGIVLPPQKIQSGAYCEFRKEIFPLVTKQIIRLTSDHKELFHFRSGAWIHTHPGLGVFFSGTDFNSFKYLTQLSPEFLAIVVDPLQNQIIGYNGILETTTEEIVEEEEEVTAEDVAEIDSEDDEASEEVKQTPLKKEEFKEVEISIVKPDLSNPVEMEFLDEFKRVLQSPAAAKEIGDTELIHAYTPMEESAFKLTTLEMKVEYLEGLLSKMETRPVYSKDLSVDWRDHLRDVQETFSLGNVLIPSTFVIKPEGLLYLWHESKSEMAADIIEWDSIESVDAIIRYERPVATASGYTTMLRSLELDVTRKKTGLFSKRPKGLRLLVLVVDSRDLYRALVEYFPKARMYRDIPRLEREELDDDGDDDEELAAEDSEEVEDEEDFEEAESDEEDEDDDEDDDDEETVDIEDDDEDEEVENIEEEDAEIDD